MNPKTNPDDAQWIEVLREHEVRWKRQTAESIFKSTEELIIGDNIFQRCPTFDKECIQCDFWENWDKIKQKYLQNPQTQPKEADNQERDSKFSLLCNNDSKESRPDVLGCDWRKAYPHKDTPQDKGFFVPCGFRYLGEIQLCDICRAKQKAQGDLG